MHACPVPIRTNIYKVLPAFTLVELLTSIAILAAIIGAALFYVAGYVTDSKIIVAKGNLQTLNDALTRYKTEGGNVNSLTAGASIGRVLRQMRTPVNWAGTTHQFLQSSFTYPARSLLTAGSKHQYHFYGYGSYTSETPSSSTPTSTYPYGQGIGYMAKAGSGNWSFSIARGTSGVVCFQDQSGNKNYRTVPTSSTTISDLPVATSYTFWACASRTSNTVGDPSPSGSILRLNIEGNSVTALEARGLTSLIELRCGYNSMTSLNISKMASLQSLRFGNTNGIHTTFVNASGCTSLNSLNVSINSYWDGGDFSDCTSLPSFYSYGGWVTTLKLARCTSMTSFTLMQLPSFDISVDLSTCTALNSILTATTTGYYSLSTANTNYLFTHLPIKTGSPTVNVGPSAAAHAADTNPATQRGWSVIYTGG